MPTNGNTVTLVAGTGARMLLQHRRDVERIGELDPQEPVMRPLQSVVVAYRWPDDRALRRFCIAMREDDLRVHIVRVELGRLDAEPHHTAFSEVEARARVLPGVDFSLIELRTRRVVEDSLRPLWVVPNGCGLRDDVVGLFAGTRGWDPRTSEQAVQHALPPDAWRSRVRRADIDTVRQRPELVSLSAAIEQHGRAPALVAPWDWAGGDAEEGFAYVAAIAAFPQS